MLEHNIVRMFIESNHGKGHYIVINDYFKSIGFLGIRWQVELMLLELYSPTK